MDWGWRLSDGHTEINVLNISFSILVCSNMHTFSPTIQNLYLKRHNTGYETVLKQYWWLYMTIHKDPQLGYS